MLNVFNGKGNEDFQNVPWVLALGPIWIGIPFIESGTTEAKREEGIKQLIADI